jgi:hypothetical protein
MSELDSAIDRLGDAVVGLIGNLTSERDQLQEEVLNLRALREDDARLRAEAAGAVKIALTDLRSVVAAQDSQRKPARKSSRAMQKTAAQKKAG